MALYSETVMDHFRNPRNVGVIEDADGVGEVGNVQCGDIMKIYLKRDEQNSWKEQPTNKANGNRKSLGHLKGAKTIAR